MEKEFKDNNQFKSVFEQKNTFGNPLFYIRLGENEIDPVSAVKGVQDILGVAFNKDRLDSLMPQLQNILELGENPRLVLDFINYGNEQLVFRALLGDGESTKKLAVLVNQPRRQFGLGKLEFDNLSRLSKIDPESVVLPLLYYENGNQELIVTQYVDDARCVYGGYKKWGMFDPRPEYHFEEFAPEVSEQLQVSMIALLVHYYDHENNLGIAKTHLSGDDFIISQDWNSQDPNTLLSNMKLISARECIHMPFAQYLDLLRLEFTQGTHYKDKNVIEENILINCKSEMPLSSDVIERGIELGKKI